MIISKIFKILPLVFLFAAGCNPFSQNPTAGLVKTVTGGTDWVAINTIVNTPKSNLLGLNFAKIIFSPESREILFAASYSGGVYKSVNAGDSWSPILSGIAVYDIAVPIQEPSTIYVGGYAGERGRLLKTTDGGKSWEVVFSEETTQNAVRAVVVNPENSTEIVIGLTSGNLVKSYDGGKNWVLLTNFEDRINRIIWQQQKLFIGLQKKGLYVSNDGGANFNEITQTLQPPARSVDQLIFQDDTSLRVSLFSQFAVNPIDAKELYVTTDIGVFRTINFGADWQKLNIPIQDAGSQFRAVAFAPSNPQIVYMSAGRTVYKTQDSGLSFQVQGIATSGFINYILVDSQLPQVAYAGIYYNE